MKTTPYYERWWEDEHRDLVLSLVPKHRTASKFSSLTRAFVDLDEDAHAWLVYNDETVAMIPTDATIGSALDTLSHF